MKYEIAERDYDRTPEGNIPQYYEEEFNSDLEAICHVYTWGDTDGMNDREIQSYLVGEGSGNEDGSPVTIEQIEGWINKSLDPSDGFTFYVKNLDTGKMVYENDYCDINEWIESLGGNPDDFKTKLMLDVVETVGPSIAIQFADAAVNMKDESWGPEGTYDEFWDEEDFQDEDLWFYFLHCLSIEGGDVEYGLDAAEIDNQEDLEEIIKSFKSMDENFDDSIIRKAFEENATA